MSRFFYWLRKIGNYKEFFEGGTVESHKLRYPFKASPNLLTAMFEIRRWFVLNSPHYMKSAQYTN